MYMHLNSYGLCVRGFKLVAAYQCFKKGEKRYNIDCYSNGKQYLVRDFESGRKCWDELFDNKDEANNYVVSLWKNYTFHKRIF